MGLLMGRDLAGGFLCFASHLLCYSKILLHVLGMLADSRAGMSVKVKWVLS